MPTLFTTDSHFLIGKSHITSGKPCQDFALSGLLEFDAAFAIAADGCSTGRHTDMGSRVLTFATARAIQAHWTTTRKSFGPKVPDEIAFFQQVGTGGVQTTLGLDLRDLLATCVYGFVSPEGGFVHLQGDGVYAFRLKSGAVIMTRFDWDNNAPCYPAYAVDNFRGYIKSQGDDVDALAMTSETVEFNSEGEEIGRLTDQISLGIGIRGITKPITPKELEGIEFIAVFSDGVTQIENLEWQLAVQQLLAFKTTAGEFATRRLTRMVKDAEKLGRGPLDDIAYAVIKVPELQPEGESHANQ